VEGQPRLDRLTRRKVCDFTAHDGTGNGEIQCPPAAAAYHPPKSLCHQHLSASTPAYRHFSGYGLLISDKQVFRIVRRRLAGSTGKGWSSSLSVAIADAVKQLNSRKAEKRGRIIEKR
jgi:hypothetical protein